MKKAHPALAFERAQLHTVRVGREDIQVWMAPDMDALLNDFIDVSGQNDEWTAQRCPFGAVLWPSARALWLWLNEDTERFSQLARPVHDHTFKVIELGSGVGFLSALLAARTQWMLTATDYEPAYERYLKANCKLQMGRDVDFATLDWCEHAPPQMVGQFDLVIACDVLYDDSHLDSVPRIASELLKPDGALLIADPERFRFKTALEKLERQFEKLSRYTCSIENSPTDASRMGVVNPDSKQTTVHIIHCQKPRIS